MALSDADTARLASLRAAYDQLIGGAQVVRVGTHGGRLVEMGKGDIPALKREIDRLEAAQASLTPLRTRGALRFRVH